MAHLRNSVALIVVLILASMPMPAGVAEQPQKPAHLFPVRAKAMWGFIDRTGTVVIEPQFNEVRPFYEGLAVVHQLPDRHCVIDTSGNVVAELKDVHDADIFSEGLAAVEIGSKWRSLTTKWGFIDQSGKLVIPAQFTARWYAGELLRPRFSEGLAAVGVGGKIGYIDRNGNTLISPEFVRGGAFWDGLAAVQVGEKWGFIDRSGRLVIQPQFDQVGSFNVCRGAQQSSPGEEGCYSDPEGGLAPVRIGKKWGYINRNGKTVIPIEFDGAGNFSEGALAAAKSGDKYGYIDKSGKFVIPPRFKRAQAFREGFAPVEVSGKWGFINTTGKLVILPQFDFAYRFVDGLARVTFGREGGVLNLQRLMKIGYIDKSGNYIWRPRS